MQRAKQSKAMLNPPKITNRILHNAPCNLYFKCATKFSGWC